MTMILFVHVCVLHYLFFVLCLLPEPVRFEEKKKFELKSFRPSARTPLWLQA